MINLKNPSFSDIEQAVCSACHQYAEFAFLLGSAATERFNDTSDIDIAVYWKVNQSMDFKLKILSSLETMLGRNVDLVSLNDIDVIYAIEVLTRGKTLLNNNKELLLNWKVTQLSKYPDFKFSRKIIENNILKRKKYD
jgi:predicted nucleotidyltransferase